MTPPHALDDVTREVVMLSYTGNPGARGLEVMHRRLPGVRALATVGETPCQGRHQPRHYPRMGREQARNTPLGW